ncbi:hypothetical protein CSC93_01005 [Klebsiella pneumoniae]|nr:hypothetical protein B6J28_23165 [Klebsiella pneumoniae]PPJ90300.1 hypothetical protein CSC93_01005 [Klebsiella pneumoniae]
MGGAAVSCLVHARKRPCGPLTRRYAPTAASPCRVNSDRVQRRLRCFSRVWLCSYHVKFPGVAEIVDEHPPKRQQQAAAAKAPEITPFTS